MKRTSTYFAKPGETGQRHEHRDAHETNANQPEPVSASEESQGGQKVQRLLGLLRVSRR